MGLLLKLKETLLSVFPIVALGTFLSLFVCSAPTSLVYQFLFGSLLVILGLSLFLLGAESGLIPIGESIGGAVVRTRKLGLVLLVGFLIGFIITVAEPDVGMLADQIEWAGFTINPLLLVVSIGLGIGLFLALGLWRTISGLPLRLMLLVGYGAVFLAAAFCLEQFVPIGFDAGGCTTGPLTVPFILALGMGVTNVFAGTNKGDSFGLTGVASIGPVLAVLLFGIFVKTGGAPVAEATSEAVVGGPLSVFVPLIGSVTKEVAASLLPLSAMIVIFQFSLVRMPRLAFIKVLIGLVYSFVGLVLFFLGAKGGFLEMGRLLGFSLAKLGMPQLCLVGFLSGLAVVFAEPAIWVLAGQVEEASHGVVAKMVIVLSLALAVAVAVVLSLLRIQKGFSVMYVLVPGYAIALILSFFCPAMWTGIAFDSGGVASGPMSSTFILSFALGTCEHFSASGALAGFGSIAFIALMPLIVIQVLGIVFKIKTQSRGGVAVPTPPNGSNFDRGGK